MRTSEGIFDGNLANKFLFVSLGADQSRFAGWPEKISHKITKKASPPSAHMQKKVRQIVFPIVPSPLISVPKLGTQMKGDMNVSNTRSVYCQ
jgi:hypothetical protein